MRHAPIDPALFMANRRRLVQQLPPGAVAILHAADILPTNGDGTLDAAEFLTLNLCSLSATGCCTGDLDGSRTVDGADLGLLLSAWGTASAAADLNHDGTVNGADLGLLLSAWGVCP